MKKRTKEKTVKSLPVNPNSEPEGAKGIGSRGTESEPRWEKWPWTVEIRRNVIGRVDRVRVLAAEPRRVISASVTGKRDRVGNFVPNLEISKMQEHISPAVVADCGVTYAGLDAETLLAHGDLLAAAPELYEALDDLLRQIEVGGPFVTGRAIEALRKARGESEDEPAIQSLINSQEPDSGTQGDQS